jgi:galactokinase/mevalonate kinase-like predicted kinase
LYPGPVLTISIEPDYAFNDRSGMATSSRKKAIELWKIDIPHGDKESLAKILFCCENQPGNKYISGSQDAFGIVMPGLNKLYYDGNYLPSNIESILDNDILTWIEQCLWLVPLYPRHSGFDVLAGTNITAAGAKQLSEAAVDCWNAIKAKDMRRFGDAFRRSFEAQIAMYPNMMSDDIYEVLNKYKNQTLGWKLSGAGGGGYLIFVNETPVENAMQIRIRR